MTDCASGSASGPNSDEVVRSAVSEAAAKLGGEASLALLFVSPPHDLGDALELARSIAPADWLGCMSAGEFTEAGVTEGGVAVMLIAWGDAVHRAAPPIEFDGDGRGAAAALDESLGALVAVASRRKVKHEFITTLMLGHGLSPELERAVTELCRTTSKGHPLVGASAGHDGTLAVSEVGMGGHIVKEGLVAVHVASVRPWAVAIGQGAVAVTPPMTVTAADANTVQRIDDRPALDIYRDYARDAGLDMEERSLADFLVAHQLGVYLFQDIARMRAAKGATEDGGLTFVGSAPAEGSAVAIVRGKPQGMIDATAAAARRAKEGAGDRVAGVLVFSCVTRRLVLGDRTPEEIAAVRQVFGPGVPICGFYSYGEVARVPDKLDAYHNHAVVVAAIPA